MEDAYKNDFEKFLSCTDEKQILLDEITDDIKRIGANSLLDIGAGNGLLSIPLSKRIDHYVAIESKVSFVEKLKEAGLTVMQATFPTNVEGSFDLVIASHSISYKKNLFEPFIRKAWELVKPDGTFLIITYRGQEDDWTNLLRELGENLIDYNRVGYNSTIELLYSLGEVKTRKVTTRVLTENIEDMLDALSFVASDGKPKRKERFMKKQSRIEKILNSRYRDGANYFFPFQHFFISTHKSN